MSFLIFRTLNTRQSNGSMQSSEQRLCHRGRPVHQRHSAHTVETQVCAFEGIQAAKDAVDTGLNYLSTRSGLVTRVSLAESASIPVSVDLQALQLWHCMGWFAL